VANLCAKARRKSTDIGSAVMKILADIRGLKIADRDKKELVETFAMP
jgi:hypothetical protein